MWKSQIKDDFVMVYGTFNQSINWLEDPTQHKEKEQKQETMYEAVKEGSDLKGHESHDVWSSQKPPYPSGNRLTVLTRVRLFFCVPFPFVNSFLAVS